MPFVTVTTVKGILDPDTKLKLLERLTDLMVEVEGRGDEKFRKTVSVVIQEQEPSNWRVGGITPTAEQIATLFGPKGPAGSRP